MSNAAKWLMSLSGGLKMKFKSFRGSPDNYQYDLRL